MSRSANITSMATKTASAMPDELTGDEWRGLLDTRPNTLLIGPADATGRVIDALLPRLQAPVCRCDAAGLSLPATSSGTLIVDDVTALSGRDQQRLLDWLIETGPATQVVTTASSALFPRVEDGAFLDVLYYRLNIMSFTFGPGGRRSA
jgi:transposase